MIYPRYYYQLRELAKIPYLAFRKVEKDKFPKTISIELNCICNANCSFCPQRKLKRDGYMDEKLFYKIIDELIGKDIEFIQPYMFGEPFLHKKIFEYLEHIRKKLSDVKIRIITNAEYLTKDKSEYLLENNLVDEIDFSVNGFYSTTIKKIMKINPEKAKKNILDFLEINKKKKKSVTTIISYVLCEDNYKEAEKFRKFWKSKIDHILFHSDDGKWTGKPFIKNRGSKYPCDIFKYFTVLSSGDVMFCCMDPFCKFPMGNLKNQTIEEIWNGKKYQELWKQHMKRKKHLNPICKNCRVTY